MNTLKFGNGEWYGKEDTILAYNDENNNYKPLPFTFERASTATVVGKDGLIKTVGSGEPRIDYKDNTDGALKLEPTRTNLVTYSEDFSNAAWAKSNVSITINSTTSPDGLLNGSLMTITGGTSDQRISDDVTYSGTNVFSVFAKANDSKWLSLRIGSIANKWFDLENGVLGGSTIATGLVDSFIEDFGNGWYRCGIIFTDSSTTNTRIYPAENDLDITHTSGSVYVYGAQAESSSSYATSLINTNGSAVTRLADVCNNGGNEQVINSTEGVLYAEISALADDGTKRYISLSDGSNSNDVRLYFDTGGYISALTKVGGSTQAFLQTNAYTQTDFNKIAFKFKENNFSLYVNGIEVATDNLGSVNTANTLNQLAFFGNLLPFYGNVKDVRVYNTALTDQELAALTQV